MEKIVVTGTTYWLPASNDDVIALVNEASQNNEIICLRGSGHSFPLIGDLEAEQKSSTGKTYKYVMLSKMYAMEMLDENTVKVQAGCHLGVDPFDPTGISTVENSLCYQLDNLGTATNNPSLNRALPDLGGITHQTIGGFMATGSSGGSTQYSFEDAVISVDVVTCQAGQGAAITTFTRPADGNPEDPFFAVGVASMGLFGVVVSATFRCIPQFYIAGSETIDYTDKCSTIDLFGTSPNLPNIQTFFQQTEYTRLMWWPQENHVPGTDLSRMVTWQAKRTDKAGAEAWAKHAYDLMGETPPPAADGLKPYEEVPYILGSPVPANIAAGLLYTAIGQWPGWLQKLLADKPLEYQFIKALVESNYATKIFPGIMDIFVTADTPQNKNKGPQLFSDRWYTGLPMDNQMSDKLMPVWFTELWIDIDQSQQVMDTLKKYYDAQPITIDLSFSCEVYAARTNDFWLSPSYQQDVIRIDVFWFGYNQGDPATFYQSFWDLLAPFNYRPHWGKYIPDVVNGTPGVTYISDKYPKWNDWMALRDKMDPQQLFVNDYWRGKLGIPAAKA